MLYGVFQNYYSGYDKIIHKYASNGTAPISDRKDFSALDTRFMADCGFISITTAISLYDSPLTNLR